MSTLTELKDDLVGASAEVAGLLTGIGNGWSKEHFEMPRTHIMARLFRIYNNLEALTLNFQEYENNLRGRAGESTT